MSTDCTHRYEFEDASSGDIICPECGLLSPIFRSPQEKQFCGANYSVENTCHQKGLSEISDILDRIHISTTYARHVAKYLEKTYDIKTLERIVFSIYKVLNDMGVKISLHEISMATGISKSDLFGAQVKNTPISVCISTLCEKYCKMLDLDYQITSLIKAKLNDSKKSGHTPMTKVAGTIYYICKREKKNQSIKKISQLTNISSISIQRYNKFLSC
jgi:transcription initiation factor TFIIIB Brf1 subunit/transcription initiation factor TFIIB